MKKRYNTETGTVTFRLKDSKSLKPTIILGTYLFKEFQTNFSTGLKVLPVHWDNKEKIVTSGSDKKVINQKIDKFKISIIDTHAKFNEQYNRLPTKEELKAIVETGKNGNELKTVRNDKKSLTEVFQEFMELIKLKNQRSISAGQKPLHKSYLSSFYVAHKDLQDFMNQSNYFLDFDTFDEAQCLEFQTWLMTENNLELGTVQNRMKRICQVLKFAFEKGYTEKRNYMLDSFKVKVPPTFNAVLTEIDITKLYEYDFSENKRLERIRDLFVLGCHTSLRFGDISRLEPQHINTSTKMISILVEKVSKSDKYVNISFPFFGYTEEILKKYDYKINEIAISNQNTNEYLKEVFKEIPYFRDKTISQEKTTDKGVVFQNLLFSDKIAFHDSRRSFCTNRYLEGWELLEIWQYTSHTNEGTFKTYVKPTFEHERIRRENIKLRNEKLQKVDLQTKEIENLKQQMAEMMLLIENGETEKLAKVVSLKKVN